MSEVFQDKQRQKLLSMLFGADVPAVLEGQLLRTSDVALLFEVSERTVSEWAKKGQIPSVRTPGGHRRYPAEGIRWLLEESRRGSRSTASFSASRAGSAAPAVSPTAGPGGLHGAAVNRAAVADLGRRHLA